jgi:tryptophan synthase beta subunit
MEPTNRQATEDALRTWHSPMQKLYHFFGAGAAPKPFMNEMKAFGAPVVAGDVLCHPTGFVAKIQGKIAIP